MCGNDFRCPRGWRKPPPPTSPLVVIEGLLTHQEQQRQLRLSIRSSKCFSFVRDFQIVGGLAWDLLQLWNLKLFDYLVTLSIFHILERLGFRTLRLEVLKLKNLKSKPQWTFGDEREEVLRTRHPEKDTRRGSPGTGGWLSMNMSFSRLMAWGRHLNRYSGSRWQSSTFKLGRFVGQIGMWEVGQLPTRECWQDAG